ncbi:hypothetical protein AHiyo6_36250, partial [Arthrobacter sp. Hiyo6]
PSAASVFLLLWLNSVPVGGSVVCQGGASHPAVGCHDPYQENEDGEVDQAEVPKGGQTPWVVRGEGHGEPDDRDDDGCDKGPPFSAAHPVPGQACDGQPGRGDEAAERDVQMAYVVIKLRAERSISAFPLST